MSDPKPPSRNCAGCNEPNPPHLITNVDGVNYRIEHDDEYGRLCLFCAVCGRLVSRLPDEAEWDRLARKAFCNERMKRHLMFSPRCFSSARQTLNTSSETN